jgi:diguanylate cyclase (GGDEF)-like protein
VRDYPRPLDDADRVAQLRSLALLDTDPEERFDRVTRLAQRLFGVPIALVSLVDADRQWFKSKQGLEADETPREDAFCTYAILGDEVMQVEDARTDPRFADNPLVLGAPEIRFYAGCPIEGPDGAKLGTLCIIDNRPRELTGADMGLLRDLAEMVEAEIAAVQMATGDELTGLSNRRGFELVGPEIMAICTTRSSRATLIYLDLDGLKAINDRLGHDAGDRALREFADQLRRVFRGSDLIARLGGDEFAVMLVGEGDPTAIRRLRDALARRNAEAGAPYPLEASLGVATFDPDAPETLEALLARADAAMYEEKRRHVAARAAS